MRILPEGERLPAPSLCFICETSPQREAGVNVVQTFRQFNPPALSHLSGEKLLCERCVEEAARLLGFVRSDDVDLANRKLAEANLKFAQVNELVKSLAKGITDSVGDVTVTPLEVIEKSPDVVKKEK